MSEVWQSHRTTYYMGGHRTEKMYTGRGNTVFTFWKGETIGWGKNIYWKRGGGHQTCLVHGGNNYRGDTAQHWRIMTHQVCLSSPIIKPLCGSILQAEKLAWSSVWMRIQEGAECGNFGSKKCLIQIFHVQKQICPKNVGPKIYDSRKIKVKKIKGKNNLRPKNIWSNKILG